ncbi:MAG: serine hydrolase [Lachnospiraceae bacterium]|nr:serine hydrolase [Lachnospiraceae bacterium]
MNRKRIRKYIALFFAVLLPCFLLTGCGETRQDVDASYALFDTTSDYISYETAIDSGQDESLFASDLCVGGIENSDAFLETVDEAKTEAVFSLSDGEVTYANNIYKKRYPASTTKILTAYVALKYGDLDQMVTVSDSAMSILDPDSSVCDLVVGDQLTLRDLLYGLMLESGNDAANMIAETVGGSIENFVDMMNEEAKALGATQSHFVNAHGMPDADHYTTAYDLYLIFQEAIKNNDFVEIISTDTYAASYLDADGDTVNQVWVNTNGYLSGDYDMPEGVTVIGGKTGTTDSAGACLVLYSENLSGDPIISIVLDAEDHRDLYECMSDLLSNFAN